MLPDDTKTITVTTENLDEVNENTRFQVDNMPENYSAYLVLRQPLEFPMEAYDKVKFESLLESTSVVEGTKACYKDGYLYTIYSDILPGSNFIWALNSINFQFPNIYRDSLGELQYHSLPIGSVDGIYSMSIMVLRANIRKFIDHEESQFDCLSYLDPVLLAKQYDFAITVK